MGKFNKAPKGPMLDDEEGAPTLGKSKAKTILQDGSVRGKKVTPKQRGLFGAIAGGAPLKMGAKAPPSAPKGPPGAGNMMADTKKYGAMAKGRK